MLKYLKICSWLIFFQIIVIFVTMSVNVGFREVVAPSDFVNYFVGAQIIKNGEANNLYDINLHFETQKQLFPTDKYYNITILRTPPFTPLLLLPLTHLSLAIGYKVFALFNIALLVVICFCITKIFHNLSNLSSLLYILTFLYFPNLQAIVLGQLSIIVLLSLLLTYSLLKNNKNFKGGLVSGLLLIKLQFFTFLPLFFFLAPKKKSFLKGLSVTIFALLTVSTIISGPSWFVKYPIFVLQTETPESGSRSAAMWSLASLLKHLFNSSSFQALSANIILYIPVIIAFIFRSRKKNFDFNFASLVLLSLAFSAHLFSYDLSLVLVPILILLNSLLGKSLKHNKKTLFFVVILYFISFAHLAVKPYLASLVFLFLGLYLLFTKNNNVKA